LNAKHNRFAVDQRPLNKESCWSLQCKRVAARWRRHEAGFIPDKRRDFGRKGI